MLPPTVRLPPMYVSLLFAAPVSHFCRVESWERKNGGATADGQPKAAVAELEEGGNEVVIVGFGCGEMGAVT